MGEGRTPSATGLLFIDGSWFINSECFLLFFFFYLSHCQAPINIHELPASEYLSSRKEEWVDREGKERVSRGIGRTRGWGERGSLWICLLPSGSPSKLQLARRGRFSANTEISQCLLLFFPSVCGKIPPTPGAEKVSALFSQLWLGNSLPWDPQLRREGQAPQMGQEVRELCRRTTGRACVAPCLVPRRGAGHKDWSIREEIKRACVCVCVTL